MQENKQHQAGKVFYFFLSFKSRVFFTEMASLKAFSVKERIRVDNNSACDVHRWLT